MNLPVPSADELLDQNLAPERRQALWAQLVVRALAEESPEPRWMGSAQRYVDARSTASS